MSPVSWSPYASYIRTVRSLLPAHRIDIRCCQSALHKPPGRTFVHVLVWAYYTFFESADHGVEKGAQRGRAPIQVQQAR